ncbi:MAG: rhomboid family intramembrane serine protease [Bryobacteraceae bacterium]
MQYRHRAGGYTESYFPSGVKWLLIVNAAVFVLDFFALTWFNADPFALLKLVPAFVLQYGMLWQLFTYMFLHSGVGHIVINMLVLWMFGVELERDWGTRLFLKYYFLCGIGAGVCVVLVSLLRPAEARIPTLGASGAIYGLLLAYGVLYADRIILFMLLFPMKAKYAVMIFGAVAFFGSWQPGGGVSHVAHLGGMIVGYLYLRTRLKRARGNPLASLRHQFQEWKRQRARRKFQVYMKKQHWDRDHWVN